MKRIKKVIQCLFLLSAINCPKWTFAQYNIIIGTVNGYNRLFMSAANGIRGSSNGSTIYRKMLHLEDSVSRFCNLIKIAVFRKCQSSNLNLQVCNLNQ